MKNKNLAYLIETELQKAEVIIAAKSVTDKFQQMAETLAKTDANDVMPLGDAMREIFGSDAAESFEQSVSETIRGLIEQIREARNTVADKIDALESGAPMNDMSDVDDASELFPDDDAGMEADMDDTDSDEEGFDDVAGEDAEDIDMDSLFSDEEEEASSTGRAKKESFSGRNKKSLVEKKIVERFAALLKEGASPVDAATVIAKKINRPLESVTKIIIKQARK